MYILNKNLIIMNIQRQTSMTIQIDVLDKKIEVRNFISIALIEQFAKRFPRDRSYVLTKSEQIKDLDEMSSLLYWFSLDEEGREIFADKLRIPKQVLSDTANGLRLIMNG